MPLLGRAELTSNATDLTLQIPANLQVFEIVARVAGYTGADIARLRFNGDSGANYAWRCMVSTSVTNGTGAAVAGIQVATVGITGARGLIWARVEKRTTALTARVIMLCHSDNEGSATAPLNYWTCGNWNNTSALITSVGLNGGTGGSSLLTGTYIECWGARDS
jgi:hypothetical protein